MNVGLEMVWIRYSKGPLFRKLAGQLQMKSTEYPFPLHPTSPTRTHVPRNNGPYALNDGP